MLIGSVYQTIRTSSMLKNLKFLSYSKNKGGYWYKKDPRHPISHPKSQSERSIKSQSSQCQSQCPKQAPAAESWETRNRKQFRGYRGERSRSGQIVTKKGRSSKGLLACGKRIKVGDTFAGACLC